MKWWEPHCRRLKRVARERQKRRREKERRREMEEWYWGRQREEWRSGGRWQWRWRRVRQWGEGRERENVDLVWSVFFFTRFIGALTKLPSTKCWNIKIAMPPGGVQRCVVSYVCLPIRTLMIIHQWLTMIS